MKKYILSALVAGIGACVFGSTYAVTFHVGSGANFDWCMTNSGSIPISYSECVGLAWLYQETNGSGWSNSTFWFSQASMLSWGGANGIFWQAFGTSTPNFTGGHIRELYLYNNNLSGAIMTGLLYLPYLEVLNLGGNSISSIDVSQNTGLFFLGLGTNRLTSLNVPTNRSLTTLAVNRNNLTGVINLVNLTGLTYIDMGYNNLTGTISFTGQLSGLVELHLQNAGLTGIDLVANSGTLQILDLIQNNFTTISLSGLRRLSELYMSGNSLTALDVTYNTGLTRLEVQNNPFNSLSVSGYTVYLPGLVARFDGMTHIPSESNTLRFLHTYDPSRGRRGLGAGKVIVVPQDNCPNGDTSPTPYDGLCSGMSSSSSNAIVATTTTGITINTGSSDMNNTGTVVSSTGMNTPARVDPDACADSETESAFMFAHEHGITTMGSCMSARMSDNVTRAEAAKMIANFAMNVRGLEPNTDMECDFSDMVGISAEMQQYAIIACQLGIMGLKGDGTPAATFNPNGLLDKAQLATMLSRLLYGAANNDAACWYCKHVDALKAEGVIKVTTDLLNPLKRGRAMLMLQRIGQ